MRYITSASMMIIMLYAAGCIDSSYPFEVVEGPVQIQYTLGVSGTVDIVVTDSYMGLVRTLVDSQEQEAGDRTVEWDLTDDGGSFAENGLYNVEIYLDEERVDVQVLEVYLP